MKLFNWVGLGLVIALVLCGSSRPLPAGAAAPRSRPEVLLRFLAPMSRSMVEQFAARHGAQRRTSIAGIGVHVLRFPAGTDSDAVAARLRADPAVAYAEPNAAATASIIPNDPGYPNQWGLAKVKAAQGWDLQMGSTTTVIAVVDTGIDPAHPDLSAKLVAGWNYDAFSPGYNTPDTSDNNGHGTHVAGISAAATNNALGVSGTCPNCAVMPVKVLGGDGSGTYDAVASGIIYAADHGAKIINLSLGGTTPSQTLQDAVTYAYNQGALVVAAAGNDGTNVATYPAALSNVMAVAATDSTDQRAPFSNYNAYISVAAPGVDIYSTYWSGTSGSTYAYLSGTSMATPMVSGLAGLLLSQDASRTNATLRSLIEQSADDVNAAGWDQYTGYGRINVGRALSGTIAGQVTDGVTGATLVNAQVDALQAGQIKASTVTQADGTYRLQYMPAGSYDIRVTLTGYTTQTRTGVLAMAGQTTANVNFSLTRAGAIAGTVTSGRKVLAGATVQARQGTQVAASTTTDTYGNYQLANLASGTYSVVAAATGYQSQTKTGIVVNPGQTTSGVNFSLSK